MLSAAKHLAAQRDRPFAEFTLSGSEGLSVTVEGPINRPQYASTSEKAHHQP